MYWIVKLDDIRNGCVILFVVSMLVFIVSMFVYFDNCESYIDIYKKITKKTSIIMKTALVVFIFSLVFQKFIPSTNQICAILVIPKVINTAQDNKEELIKLPNAVITLGLKWIQKMSSDLDSVEVK
jgi:hypothetical protein